jgi:hypothetical protein
MVQTSHSLRSIDYDANTHDTYLDQLGVNDPVLERPA